MIKVENIEVFNFEGAIRGMRNPMNSWDKSDSGNGCCKSTNYQKFVLCDNCPEECVGNALCDRENSYYQIGENDLDLMHRLYVAGVEHRKVLRQIFVSMDVTAPTYVWAEIDTYKVGVTRNSCSFMHKGLSKPFEYNDFSTHGYCKEWDYIIDELNDLREKWLETKDAELFERIRCMLPSGYNQKATLTMNYENVVNIINQRSNHRLSEWREFCKILRDLPYVREIMEG